MKRKFNVLSSHLMYVFATVALCTLIIIITWLGFRSELTIESGSVDGQVETMISFNDWESINGYVLNGGISSGKAENVLNRGYCLQYMDSWKAAGKIPSEFTPASQKSSKLCKQHFSSDAPATATAQQRSVPRKVTPIPPRPIQTRRSMRHGKQSQR